MTPTEAAGDARRAIRPAPGRAVVSTLSVLVFVLAWELAPRVGLVDTALVSQPSRILLAGTAIVRAGEIWTHAAVSLQELAGGMALAVLIGVPAGLVVGVSRAVRRFVDPPLMALQAAPRLALLPVLIVWLGIGMASKVAVVFIGAVLPIVVATAAGVREVEASLVQVARAFGARPSDVMRRVVLPATLPAIMMGVRLGAGRGILGVVVGEMYVSQEGIGHQIMQLGSSFRIDDLVFYTILVSAFGLATTAALRAVERRLRPWGEEV